MRLISQDKLKDIPYETTALYISGTPTDVQIVAFADNDAITIGEYTSEEKALKVMSKLREDWKDDLAFFKFPADEEAEV